MVWLPQFKWWMEVMIEAISNSVPQAPNKRE
jgi:hypothetical protein